MESFLSDIHAREHLIKGRIAVSGDGKIQAVGLETSPFDRRHGMASVQVDTAAAGPLGSAIDIPFLDRAVARQLYDTLNLEAAQTAFRW